MGGQNRNNLQGQHEKERALRRTRSGRRIGKRFLSVMLSALLIATSLSGITMAHADGGFWTVTYKVNGVDYASETVADGAVVDQPPADPVDTSGDFIGWYKENETIPVDLDTMVVTSDLTLDAKFSNTNGVVRFRDRFSNVIGTQTVATVGALSAKPSDVQAGLGAGETIAFWFVQGGPESDWFAGKSANDPVRGVVVLVPKIVALYTVTFDSQGGSAVSPLNGAAGQATPQPASNPTRQGYSFRHWSTTPDGSAYGFSTPLTGGLTLYAVWGVGDPVGFRIEYWLSDDGNALQTDFVTPYEPVDRTQFFNRVSVDVPASESQYSVGAMLSAAEIKVLAEEHYFDAQKKNFIVGFFEYYENPSHPNPAQAMPLQEYALNASGQGIIKVYYTQRKVDIHFDSNGGDLYYNGAVKTDHVFEASALAYLTPGSHQKLVWPLAEGLRENDNVGAVMKKPGYTLTGWKLTDATLNGVSTGYSAVGTEYSTSQVSSMLAAWSPYVSETSSHLFDNLTLQAIWTPNTEGLMLHFRSYVEVSYNNWLEIDNGEETSFEVESQQFSPVTQTFIHFANTEEMHFSNQGWENFDSYATKAFLGANYNNSTQDTIYKKIFGKKTGNNTYEAVDADDPSATDVIVYRCLVRQLWPLDFMAGAGTFAGGENKQTEQYKNQYPILFEGNTPPPEPTPPVGQEFEGWYLEQGLVNKLTNQTVKNGYAEAVYAKYLPLTPEVKFYDAKTGGTQLGSTVEVNYGQSFANAGKTDQIPEGTDKPGSGTFKGWYYTSGGNEYAFTETTPLMENLIVYASYNQVEYGINFHGDEDEPTQVTDTRSVWSDPSGTGKNTLSLGGGENRRLPVLAYREGFAACWTTGQNGTGMLYTATTLVTANMDVYPYYDELVTIDYVVDTGGTGLTRASERVSALYGTALGASVETLTGYEFDGWYDGVTKVADTLTFVPSKNNATPAKYEGKTYTAKFKAVITYRSVNTALGTVSPEQEKVDPAGTALGSTATTVGGPDASFVKWVDSRGNEVSTNATFIPPSVPETYTALFAGPNYATINYVVVKTGTAPNDAWGGQVSPAAESLLKGTGTALGATATAYAGFAFDFWSESPNGAAISGAPETFVPTKPGTEWTDKTYYAHFKEASEVTIEYKVGSASAGKGSVSPQSETLRPFTGSAAGSTPVSIPGYRFVKWTTDDAGLNGALASEAGGKFVPSKETVHGNSVYVARSYYAHFEEDTATINYAVGNVPGGMVSNSSDSLFVISGDPLDTDVDLALTGSVATAHAGYSFVGWASDAAGNQLINDAAWVSGTAIMPQKEAVSGASEDMYVGRTYYAIFSADAVNVTYFYTGATEYTNQNVGNTLATKVSSGNYNATLASAPIPEPTRLGYVFGGWYTQADGAGTAWIFGDSSTGTALTQANGVNVGVSPKTLALYAKWIPQNYTFIFSKNDTTPPSEESKTQSGKQIGDTVTPPTVGSGWDSGNASNSAMSIIGYARTANASVAEFSSSFILNEALIASLFPSETSVTLYAVWRDLNGYTLSYDANGGSGAVPATTDDHYAGDRVSLQGGWTGLSKTGYSFYGWSTTRDAFPPVSEVTFASGNITVYAVWFPKNYNVHFNANGGNGTANSAQGLQVGNWVNLPNNAFTREHYSFAGFAPVATAASPSYVGTGFGLDNNTINTLFANDTLSETTLYAIWNINQYTVTYSANGGTGQVIDGNNPYNALSLVSVLGQGGMTRAGYTFDGWALAPAGAKAYDAGNTFSLTGNTTLYAVWQPVPVIPVTPETPPVDTPTETIWTPGGGGVTTPTPDEVLTDIVESGVPTVTIGEREVPLTSGGSAYVWALVNLILAIGGVVLTLIAIIHSLLRRKREEDSEEKNTSVSHWPQERTGEDKQEQKQRRPAWLIVTALMAVLGVVVFCLTENMNNLMVMVDNWTILNAIIFVFCIFGYVLAFKHKKKDENQDPNESKDPGLETNTPLTA